MTRLFQKYYSRSLSDGRKFKIFKLVFKHAIQSVQIMNDHISYDNTRQEITLCNALWDTVHNLSFF